MTHEIHIQSQQNKSDFKKKDLALKATEEDPNNDESSSSSSEDSSDTDELTMLSKRVQRLMKLKKKGKKPMNNNKEPTCYNCGKSGHFKADCFKKIKMINSNRRILTKERRSSTTRKARGPWRQPGPMKMLHLVNYPKLKKLV